MKSLGSVVKQISGVTYQKSQASTEPLKGYKPVLRAGNISASRILESDLIYIPENLIKTDRLLKYGDILIAASSGSLSVVGKAAMLENDMDAGFGAFCRVLRPNVEVIFPRYLKFFFETDYYKNTIKNLAAGVNINNLKPQHFNSLEIPLPPLAEQKQIAAILDAADSLRQKDQQLLEHYTALSQSLFLEMFGDVFLNNKHYPKATFKQLLDKVQIGPFGSQLHKHDYVENGVPLINPVHIIQSKVLPSNSFSILKKKYDSLPNYHLKEGDLIMARRGEMGRCALITRQEEGFFCGTGSLYLRPNNNVNSTFLLYVITSNSGKSYLERNAQGVTMMNLNKKIILNIEIGLPSIELQNQFEVAINLIENQKQQAQANLQKSEALFNSLLQRAFTGELTADKAA